MFRTRSRSGSLSLMIRSSSSPTSWMVELPTQSSSSSHHNAISVAAELSPFQRYLLGVLVEAKKKELVNAAFVYRLYCTPLEVLSFLKHLCSLQKLDSEVKYIEESHIVSFLKEWANSDFVIVGRKIVFEKLLQLVEREFPSEANYFKLWYIRHRLKKERYNNALKHPVVSSSKPVTTQLKRARYRTLLSTPVETIASYLTTLEWHLLNCVSPTELYMRKQSNNLQRCIHFFNTISFWVATEIVNAYQLSATTQIEVVKKFIQLANVFVETKNFDLVMAINCALNSSSISRLKTMWSKIPKESIDILRKLEDMMQPTQNYRNYRNALASCPKETPRIPYLGLLLRDVTFFCDGNNSYIENGSVNLEKVAMIGNYLQEFHDHISVPYPVVDCKKAHHLEIDFIEEDKIYETSLLCEPRRTKCSISASRSPSGNLVVAGWNSVEVVLWLQRRFLDEYAPIFSKNKVNGSALISLKPDDLVKMGIENENSRERIIASISELLTSANEKPILRINSLRSLVDTMHSARGSPGVISPRMIAAA